MPFAEHKMMTAAAVALALLESTMNANAGPTYSREQIRAFSLADLRLGMTQSEAEKVLDAAGYEGRFPKEVEDPNMVKPWIQFDRAVFVSRYTDELGVNRIWRIRYGQSFDVALSIEDLRRRVVTKYGAPTDLVGRSEIDGDTYHVPFTTEHSRARFCDAGADPSCWRTLTLGTTLSADAVQRAFKAEILEPTLSVEYQPKVLYLTLTDHGLNEAAKSAAAARVKVQSEEKSRASIKNVKMGF